MASMLEQHILRSSMIGFARHRILLDDAGKPADYEFLEINDTFERLFGLDRHRVLRRPAGEFFPRVGSKDFEWISICGEVALNGGEREFERYFDSLGRWYRVNVHSAERLFFTTIFLDITESRRQADELRYERDLFSSGPVFTIEWEYTPERPVRRVSPNVFGILGYTPEEMTSPDFRFLPLAPPEDRERISEEVKSYIEHGIDEYELTYRMRLKSGEYRWFHDFTKLMRDERGDVKTIRGCVFDVNEEHRRREELRKTLALFNATQRLTKVGGWEWDAVRQSMFWTDETYRIHGMAPEELPAGSPEHIEASLSCYDPDDLPLIQELFQRCAQQGEPYDREFPLTKLDGRRIWIRTVGNPVFENGQIVGVVGNFMDITDRKLAEEALRQAKEQAEAASIAKSQFLANMSHEIRTPMNGVLGMTELLLNTQLDSEQRHFAGTIRASAESLLDILNDILDFSKVEAGMLDLNTLDFELGGLLEDFAVFMNTSAEQKGLFFFCDIDPDVPLYLRGDPGRLRQILTNLAGNAVKFTREGEVRVNASLVDQSENYILIRFSVRDTGIGIPSERLASLFDKFVQVDASTTRKHGGTGLGLAISKELAELMGGSISVESKEGAGSHFWFTIPLEKQPQGVRRDQSRNSEAVATPRFERSARVLLVEDNPINRSIALRMLANLGLSADAAENGEQALEALGRDSYEIVLMDCQMPVMDGYEATRRIRSLDGEARGVPIVAMTAHAMVGDREKCLEAGMNDYLTKPISRRALAEAIARWLKENKLLFWPPVDPPKKTRQEENDASERSVWNRGALLGRLEGDEEFLRELVEPLVSDVTVQLVKLKDALERGECAEAAKAAHSIKGSAANMNALSLEKAALELEKALKSGCDVYALPLLESLEFEFRRLEKIMRRELSRN